MTKILDIIKNVIKYVTSAVLIFCIVVCLYSFFVIDILHREYVNVFGYTYFIVATGSMSGTINVDDVVIVKITDDVVENDIVTFRNKQKKIITHRLIDVDKDRLITKGDANNIADDPIKDSWTLHLDSTRTTCSLRNLIWPGYFAYHKANTDEFGGVYIGYGIKNIDIPFMQQ